MIKYFFYCCVFLGLSFSSIRQNNPLKNKVPLKGTLTLKLGLIIKRIINILNKSK